LPFNRPTGLHLSAQHLDAAAVALVATGQPRKVAQQRGLAGTGCTDQGDHLAAGDGEFEVDQRGFLRKGLVQAIDMDSGSHGLLCLV
jgi:hypothetical protein